MSMNSLVLLVSALLVVFLAWLARAGGQGSLDVYYHNTYYVIAHSGLLLIIALCLVGLAALHAICERLLGAWSLSFGAVHVGLTVLGGGLMITALYLASTLHPSFGYPAWARLHWLTLALNLAGFVGLLLGQGVLIVAILRAYLQR